MHTYVRVYRVEVVFIIMDNVPITAQLKWLVIAILHNSKHLSGQSLFEHIFTCIFGLETQRINCMGQ